MKNFEQPSPEKLDYAFLKQTLLNGGQSPKEVYLKLLDADQADAHHKAASDNLIFLQDIAVQEYIATQSIKNQKLYKRLEGFTQWHIAQNLMFEGRSDEGLVLFKQSVQNSIDGGADPSWIAYEQGTIAYLEKNVDGLKESIAQEKVSEKNNAIMRRMLARIEEGNEPDYTLDY